MGIGLAGHEPARCDRTGRESMLQQKDADPAPAAAQTMDPDFAKSAKKWTTPPGDGP